MRTLGLTVVTDSSGLDDLRDEWERLLDRSECRSVYLTWEWIRSWWAEYSEDRELFILCLRDGGSLVALFPMVRTEERFLKLAGYRTLGYLGTGEREDAVCPSSLQPIVLPEHAEAACDAFAEALTGRFRAEWDVLRLEAMDASSSVVRSLEKALSTRHGRARTHVMFRSGWTRLDAGWDAYLRSLGHRTRRRIRRGTKLLQSLPGFEYGFLQGGQDASPMLDEIVRMSVKRRGAKSAFSGERFLRFQHAVCRALQEKGRLKLSWMRVEGRVVAGNLDYCHKDVVHGYQTAFDPDFRPAVGVGFLSMVCCLENAAREGYRVYDWYESAPGDYKQHLLNERRDMIAITLHRTSRMAWRDTIPRILGKTRRAFEEGGTRTVLARTWRKLYRRNSAVWYTCDLTRPLPLFESSVPVTMGREVAPDVIDYMRRKGYLAEPELRVALENGHWFLGLRHDGVVKGFRKCGFGRVFVSDFGQTIELSKDVVFFYESEVDESLRRRGVAKYFMSHSLRLARDSGYRFALCHVPAWNVPSTKVVERCGFAKLVTVNFVEFAKIKVGPGRLRRYLDERIGPPR